MGQVYFIGGSPRVGKTKLLLKFLEGEQIRSLSTDALREVLQHAIERSQEPDLFAPSAFIGSDIATRRDIHLKPDEVVAKQNRESVVVWRSVEHYMDSVLSDGSDIVVEGVAILPEFIARSKFKDYHAVFIGNRSSHHVGKILENAHQDEYDWLHGVNDDIIESFGLFAQKFSEYLYVETKKYGLQYVEMNDNDFVGSLAEASRILRAGSQAATE